MMRLGGRQALDGQSGRANVILVDAGRSASPQRSAARRRRRPEQRAEGRDPGWPGRLNAREEVTEVADLLGAPVAKALLGKAVLADNSPFTTGGIGHLGTAPSSWAMKNCDTVLIIGSTMPWFEYYPKPGQARGVQIDMKPDRIGLRYPVEIGLVSDAKATLAALHAAASASVGPRLSSGGAKPHGELESVAGRGRSRRRARRCGRRW